MAHDFAEGNGKMGQACLGEELKRCEEATQPEYGELSLKPMDRLVNVTPLFLIPSP